MLAPVLVALSLAVASFAQTSHTYVFQDFEKGLGTWEVFGTMDAFRLESKDVVPRQPSMAAMFRVSGDSSRRTVRAGLRWTSDRAGHTGGPLSVSANAWPRTILNMSNRVDMTVQFGPQSRAFDSVRLNGRGHTTLLVQEAPKGPFTVRVEVATSNGSSIPAHIDNIRVFRPARGTFTGFKAFRPGSTNGRALIEPNSPGALFMSTKKLAQSIRVPGFTGDLWLDPSTAVTLANFATSSKVATISVTIPNVSMFGVPFHFQIVQFDPFKNLAYIGPLTSQVGG